MRNGAWPAPPDATEIPFRRVPAGRTATTLRFDPLVLPPSSSLRARGATFVLSVTAHAALAVVFVLLPLLLAETLPEPGAAVRAFFAAPVDLAPPPPPPPPPAAGPRPAQRPVPQARPVDPARFTAPIEIPAEIKPEIGLDLGVEGGVAGGVEGGIPGGVVGGIVGGLPEAAPPPARVVRIGGQLVAPKLVRQVPPVYPDLALQARVSAIVILEALVDTRGSVQDVKVLRGHPLFDAAAMAAVRQWRYQPLLLNGQPTDFILSVTVMFNFKGVAAMESARSR
jgi:periplasmic protein TonB